MDLLASTFSKRPSLFAAAALLLSVAAAVGISRVRFSESPRGLFKSGDAAFYELERMYEDFGSDDGDCLVLIETPDVLSPAACALIRELDDGLAEVDGIVEVTSLADLMTTGGLLPRPLLPKESADSAAREAARAAIEAHPLGADQLVDPTFRSTILLLRMTSGDMTVAEMMPVIEDLDARIASLDLPPQTSVAMTGIPPLRAAIFGTIQEEQRSLSLLGLVLSLSVAGLLFRKVGPVLVAGLPSLFAGLWAAGLVGWLGVPFDVMTAQLPLLVQIIALCDAVHLTHHILERRRAGLSRREAAASSLSALGGACMLTTFTTAVGFISLAVSRADAIQQFGLLFGASVLMAFLAVILFVPLCATWLLRAEPDAYEARAEARMQGLGEKLLGPLLDRPRLTSCFGLLLAGLTCAGALSLKPDNRLAESSPEGHPATDALFRIEELYGGLVGVSVRVDWPLDLASSDARVLDAIRDASDAIERTELHRGALSLPDFLSMVPGSEPSPGESDPRVTLLESLTASTLSSYWRPDISSARISARVPDANSPAVEAAHTQIQSDLAALGGEHPGFNFFLTGTGVVARRNIDTIITDLARGLFIAAVTIFLALSVFLRSWRLGLVSLVPNLLPLSVTGCALVLFDHPLQVASAIAFSVCLGIAVDDTIHFLHRWRRERPLAANAHEAAQRTFVGVGLPILVTSLVLAAGFLALQPSVVATTRLFGWIILGGLATAVFADLFLLPALLVATDPDEGDDQ